MKKTFVFLLVISALVCCKNSDKKENQPIPVELSRKTIEDCVFDNGKAFSEIRQACVELDSLPFKLNPLEDGMMVKGDPAYLLFDSSKKKAELFFPQKEQGILLEQTKIGSWNYGDYVLIAWKGYVVKLNGKPIYGGQ